MCRVAEEVFCRDQVLTTQFLEVKWISISKNPITQKCFNYFLC